MLQGPSPGELPYDGLCLYHMYTSRVLQNDNYVIDTLAMATGYNLQFNDIGIGVLYKQIQEVYSLFASGGSTSFKLWVMMIHSLLSLEFINRVKL
jgi:hypothetical protein